jgi:hypothetical protein
VIAHIGVIPLEEILPVLSGVAGWLVIHLRARS